MSKAISLVDRTSCTESSNGTSPISASNMARPSQQPKECTVWKGSTNSVSVLQGVNRIRCTNHECRLVGSFASCSPTHPGHDFFRPIYGKGFHCSRELLLESRQLGVCESGEQPGEIRLTHSEHSLSSCHRGCVYLNLYFIISGNRLLQLNVLENLGGIRNLYV